MVATSPPAPHAPALSPWHDHVNGELERVAMTKVQKSDEQWRAELGPEEYAVLRQAATERPGTGALLEEKRVGVYRCRACGTELFRSETKFESHCGWPSFYDASDSDAVRLIEDRSVGMVRTEVRCATCDSHLGHLFDDAPQTPTGDRYCMNSVALTFEPVGGAA
jgi:peptide-methionine (R)-S-oxide reductase